MHWFAVPYRIEFRLSWLVYKSLHRTTSNPTACTRLCQMLDLRWDPVWKEICMCRGRRHVSGARFFICWPPLLEQSAYHSLFCQLIWGESGFKTFLHDSTKFMNELLSMMAATLKELQYKRSVVFRMLILLIRVCRYFPHHIHFVHDYIFQYDSVFC
jgi:hypothetical protein